jgi:hypothetical protein
MANPKEIRGLIVGVLAAAYPTPVTDRRVFLTLDKLEFDTPKEQLRGYLMYLRDAGYIELEQDFDELTGDFARAWLTGKGLQLVRGEREADSFVDPKGYERPATDNPALRKRG